MKNVNIWLALIVLTIGMVLAATPTASACGIIEIDRRLVPPNIQVTNISVKNTSLDIKIEDNIAMVTVDEIFHNPNFRQLEGTFILPILPEASVQNLSLWINGTESKGELLDSDKALQYYQEIVRRRIDPALLEYAGYGLLKLRVFPIPPHNQDLGVGPGNVRIKYSYTYRISNDNGLCAFRHPWGTNKFSEEAIDSAVIKATIKSGTPIKTVYSPTYPNIDIVRKDDRNVSISFEQNKMKPDKDFLLYYSLSEKQFGINLVTYKKVNTDGFFMMMLSPKYEMKDSEIVKKDVVFVLDTSGSMLENGKIEQAKKSLNFCISSLRDSDRFNLVTFSGDIRQFKDGLQDANATIRAEAVKWVKDIEARGGTNINDALQSVLGMVEPNSKRPFMIVFLTDGIPTIGEQNPQQILKNVAAKNTANIRIFTFGVGFDVNTQLLDKLAEANRGAREYITPGEDIEVKISNFYEKIAYPVLSDIKVEVSGIEIYDRYPKNPADIFRGSQMVILGRYKGEGQKLITLTGSVNGESRKFEYESTFGNTETGSLELTMVSHGNIIKQVEPANKAPTDFIPRIWATSKIGYLMDEIRLRGENKEVKEEIIKLAKEYGILTPYTSWLVVEDVRTASSPGIGGLRDGIRNRAGLPTNPASPQPIGSGAVDASKEAESLQKGDAEATRKNKGELSEVIEETVKQVGDKTFYLSKGIWYDSLYQEKDKDKITKVKYLSDEYFDLVKKNTQLAKYFALGKNVIVCFGDKIYEIITE